MYSYVSKILETYINVSGEQVWTLLTKQLIGNVQLWHGNCSHTLWEYAAPTKKLPTAMYTPSFLSDLHNTRDFLYILPIHPLKDSLFGWAFAWGLLKSSARPSPVRERWALWLIVARYGGARFSGTRLGAGTPQTCHTELQDFDSYLRLRNVWICIAFLGPWINPNSPDVGV